MTTVRRGVAYLTRRKILLVQGNNVVLSHNHTDTGNAIPIIASLLMDRGTDRAFITGVGLYDIMADLNAIMQESVPGWRMRITNRRRIALVGPDKIPRISGRFFVDYLAIDERRNGRRTPRRRFDVINLDLLTERPPTRPDEQLEMALSILEMCDNREIAFRGTRGGLGSAMLKKSPYWEDKRYAAPKFINDKARDYLPGNFYSLSWKLKYNIPHCFYIDQDSSHHNIVSQVPLPHPQHVHARGNWKSLKGKWCTPDSPTGKSLVKQSGLIYCRILIGAIGPSIEHMYPPWATKKRGIQNVWLWTPELRLLEDHRFQVEYFIASFTASTYDMVLPEYATWALGELANNQRRTNYKKGSLLAAYGMLAFNGAGKTLYRYWGGENSRPKCEIPRAGLVSESRVQLNDNIQLSTVNVIARGIIESETRTRSIEMARELHSQGFHIPQIYADGLLVETDSLPFLPEGWRISHSLTNVHIPRSNAIISDQIVKLPGVGGLEDDRAWEQTREESQVILPTDERIPVA